MGLVSATEMLKKAKEGHYAVGQFNINNLEWTKSVLTAEELKAPVILGVSEGAAKYMTGYTTVAAMVKTIVEALNITVPVALHFRSWFHTKELKLRFRCRFLFNHV